MNNHRQAWFLNSVLFNSEVWQKTNKGDICELEKVDNMLLRNILNAHMKTPLEFLHLETATLPIKFLMMLRRIMYLKVLINRDSNELTKKIYMEMRNDPG